jgi:very-short-patch-repair endonuclease
LLVAGYWVQEMKFPSWEHSRQLKDIVFKGGVEKVTPPFEGGVAGIIDYLMFTRLISRPGWLIYSFSVTFISMINKNLFNRKDLKSFRSSLRNRSTSAEAELWEELKSKKLEGRKFRRQYSIGRYIVDFCCPSEKLIIELDGDPHGESQKIEKDEIRDNYLEGLGFIVLRFENRFVFQEPEYIKSEIRKVFNKKLEAI